MAGTAMQIVLQRRGFERSLDLIGKHEPATAYAFRQTVGILLQDTLADSDRQAAWTMGLMSGSGAPLEFSFSTLTTDLRYTVEVGGPNLPPERRLERLDSLAIPLGWGDDCQEITRQMRRLQGEAPLRWGCWLGLRHRTEDGRASFKIYAEMPSSPGEELKPLLDAYLGPLPALSGRPLSLLLIGRSPGTQRCEFYFALPTPGLHEPSLAKLLAHAGLEERTTELVDLVRSCEFFASPDTPSTLPQVQYGCSYAVLPGVQEPVFSLFAFAGELIGGDGAVRDCVLRATHARGWDLGLYAALTEPLAGQLFRSGYHNTLTFTVSSASVLGLHVSVSPPPPEIPAE